MKLMDGNFLLLLLLLWRESSENVGSFGGRGLEIMRYLLLISVECVENCGVFWYEGLGASN